MSPRLTVETFHTALAPLGFLFLLVVLGGAEGGMLGSPKVSKGLPEHGNPGESLLNCHDARAQYPFR